MSEFHLFSTTITSRTKKDEPLSISLTTTRAFRDLKKSIERTFSKDIATNKIEIQINTAADEEAPLALHNITLKGLLIWDGIEMKELSVLYSPQKKRVVGITGRVFSFFGLNTLSDLEKLYNTSNIKTKGLIDIREGNGMFIAKELFVYYSNATRHFTLSDTGVVMTDLLATIDEEADKGVDEDTILPIEIRDKNDVISGNLSLDTYIDDEFLTYNGAYHILNKSAFLKAFSCYPISNVSFYKDASGKRTWEKIVLELDTKDSIVTIFDNLRYCTPNLMVRNDCTYHKKNNRIAVRGAETRIIEITPVCC